MKDLIEIKSQFPNFSCGSCFCTLLNAQKQVRIEDVAFRQLLALDHQTLHRGIHKYAERE